DTTLAPLNSLMGVFLTDEAPTATPSVSGLDYSTEEARERFVHRPKNKQIFFIGDGVRNTNSRLQRFVVPQGATRLFLGVSDEYGFWWDNFGDYRTTMFTGDVRLVE
ncbi:MAG: PEP-CTERM sorting domain-containing protein, partial [Planctomycetota bacterium]